MPHVPFTIQWEPSWDLKRFAGEVRRSWEQLRKVVNNHINFGNPSFALAQGGIDNIDGMWVPYSTPGMPNTDFVLNHNLNRVPAGYWVMTKSAAVDIYTGSVAATSTQITLRATVGSVTGYLFVI